MIKTDMSIIKSEVGKFYVDVPQSGIINDTIVLNVNLLPEEAGRMVGSLACVTLDLDNAQKLVDELINVILSTRR